MNPKHPPGERREFITAIGVAAGGASLTATSVFQYLADHSG
jgi:hypothetical protein